VFLPPEAGHSYVIGADPAEGNPQSDESAATVVDATTGEQCALVAGRYDPAVFASYVDSLSKVYGRCPVMVERNNHGHAVILWLREFGTAQIYNGLDRKPGWMTTGNSKPLAVDNVADALRDGQTTIHDNATMMQLAGLEGSTLRAPTGEHDDRAMAFILAHAALRWRGELPAPVVGHDPFAPSRAGGIVGARDVVRGDAPGTVRWVTKRTDRTHGLRFV
jgi:hypothetical protein